MIISQYGSYRIYKKAIFFKSTKLAQIHFTMPKYILLQSFWLALIANDYKLYLEQNWTFRYWFLNYHRLLIFRPFLPRTGKWGVLNREPPPNHRLLTSKFQEKRFNRTERPKERLQIYIKGFNILCCMIIEKTMVI